MMDLLERRVSSDEVIRQMRNVGRCNGASANVARYRACLPVRIGPIRSADDPAGNEGFAEVVAAGVAAAVGKVAAAARAAVEDFRLWQVGWRSVRLLGPRPRSAPPDAAVESS